MRWIWHYFVTVTSQARQKHVTSTTVIKWRKQISKTIERSRYISTELGIRERLVSAIITNEDTVHSMAVSVNKTLSHHLQKLLFFFGTQEKGFHAKKFSRILKPRWAQISQRIEWAWITLFMTSFELRWPDFRFTLGKNLE